MRRLLVFFVACLICTAPAQAAPRPLAALSGGEKYALAGDQVLFTHTTGGALQVRSLPIAGGEARTLITVTAPRGEKPSAQALVASPTRAALLVAYAGPDSRSATQLFGATPGGAWGALTPRRAYSDASAVTGVQIDGDNLFAFAYDGDDYEVVVYDPARRVLPLRAFARFGGDLALYAADTDAGFDRRVVVTNWRTGELVSTNDFPDHVRSLAVKPDGRAAVSTDRGFYELAPGLAPRRLASPVFDAAFSGERLITYRGGIEVFDPGAKARRMGIPTGNFDDYLADAQNILWRANNCLLVAPVTDGLASEPGPGPCVRSEIVRDEGPRARRARTLSLPLHCIAAPAKGCRATVRLSVHGRAVSTVRHVRLALHQRLTVRFRLVHSGLARIDRAGGIGDIEVFPLSGPRQPDLLFGVASPPGQDCSDCG